MMKKMKDWHWLYRVFVLQKTFFGHRCSSYRLQASYSMFERVVRIFHHSLSLVILCILALKLLSTINLNHLSQVSVAEVGTKSKSNEYPIFGFTLGIADPVIHVLMQKYDGTSLPSPSIQRMVIDLGQFDTEISIKMQLPFI